MKNKYQEALKELKEFVHSELDGTRMLDEHLKHCDTLQELVDKNKVYTLEEVKKEWEELGYEWKENIYENSIGLRKEIKEKFFDGEHEVYYLIIINFIDKTYSAEKRSCFTAEGIELTFQEHQLLTKIFKALGWDNE